MVKLAATDEPLCVPQHTMNPAAAEFPEPASSLSFAGIETTFIHRQTVATILNEPFKEAEVLQGLEKLNNNRAPGLDGNSHGNSNCTLPACRH